MIQHVLMLTELALDLDNIPSLKGNIKLGFEVKEKYWDENEQKERVYLVCDLNKYRVNKK